MRSFVLDAEHQHQQQLVESYKTTTDKRLRERMAVLMTAQGHSQPAIAAALCLSTHGPPVSAGV